MREITEILVAASDSGRVVIQIHRPRLVERIFFLASGMIVSVPLTLFIESFTNYLCVMLPPISSQLCSVVIIAPLVEEFAKAYPLLYRHGETGRSIFTLGFLTGLGFGVTEFMIYTIILQVPILFRLPGLFFHAASTSIVAYGIATKRPFSFYLLAVVLHLSANLFASSPLWMGSLLVTFLAYFASWSLYGKTSERVVT